MIKEYTRNILQQKFDIDTDIIDFVSKSEEKIIDKFSQIDSIKEYNQYKVINAMQKNRLSTTDFYWTTGYGYGDIGRDKVEDIYSMVFNTESALVRPTIASGTHALHLTLSGLLRPGNELLSITGAPYDTLQQAIGTKGDISGTLLDYGVKYNEVPFINNKFDFNKIKETINENTKIVLIQRSTGYSNRRAVNIKEIQKAVDIIREFKKDLIIMVDNCYGEFLEIQEPTDTGVDIIAGSLIKNPGGGLALSGGYIAGKEKLVNQVANKLTAPGLGRDCGLTFGTTRTTLQGLFLAPHIVSEAVKGALLVASVYKDLGFKIIPEIEDERSDIIQGVELLSEERVCEFCKGIQAASPVDHYIMPEAWEMPGYEDKVIMAAGGFIDGSSIELSADGPMREPYYAYYQGGLTYEHCKLGIYKSLKNLCNKNLIELY